MIFCGAVHHVGKCFDQGGCQAHKQQRSVWIVTTFSWDFITSMGGTSYEREDALLGQLAPCFKHSCSTWCGAHPELDMQTYTNSDC
jgi:hypothetical protein